MPTIFKKKFWVTTSEKSRIHYACTCSSFLPLLLPTSAAVMFVNQEVFR